VQPQVAPAVHIPAVRTGIQILVEVVVASTDLMEVVGHATAARMGSAVLGVALVEQRFAVVGNRFLVVKEGSHSPGVPKDLLVAD
jgi:hypothetical protein